MSASGISGSKISPVTQKHPQRLRQVKTEIPRVRGDLQPGNLSQARQNFTALSQNFWGAQQSAINQDFSALGQALRVENLSNAKNAYTKLNQDVQQAVVHANDPYDRRHHAANWQRFSRGGQSSNPILEAFAELGNALESSDLSRAKSGYSKIQQALQQYGLGASTPSSRAQR